MVRQMTRKSSTLTLVQAEAAPESTSWMQRVEQAHPEEVFALLDKPKAAERVQALSELETYYAIKNRGLGDSTALLGLLSIEQTRALLDLEVWQQSKLSIPDTLHYLEAFREAGTTALFKAATSLDQESLAVLFRRRLYVTLKPNEERSDPEPLPEWAQNPSEEILPLVETQDSRFIVAARVYDEFEEKQVDEEERKSILRLLTDLYRQQEWEWTAGILRLASTDLSSSLEEESLRFRNARLEDLGFPSLERALDVYGALTPKILEQEPAAPAPQLSETLPGLYVAPLAEGLFHRVMSELNDPELEQKIQADLVPLCNSVLVADGSAAGDLEGLQDTLQKVRATIELALSHGLYGAELLPGAVERLRNRHVTELFRVGHTVTLRLRTRALELMRHPALEPLRLAAFSDRERLVLEGLLYRRPLYSPVLDSWAQRVAEGEDGQIGRDLSPGAETDVRPFGREAERKAASQFLAHLEALLAAETHFKLVKKSEDLPETIYPQERFEQSLQVLYTTAAAQKLLGNSFAAQALDGEALLDLCDSLAGIGSAADAEFPEIDVKLQASFGELSEVSQKAMGHLVQKGLKQLAEQLWPLIGQETIDPRFIEGILRSK